MHGFSWLEGFGDEAAPEVLWQDGERRFCRIRRDGVDGNRLEGLAVLPASEHPTPGCVGRLVHEYGLRSRLGGAWALRPLELWREKGRAVLVLEFHDGEPLDRLIGSPMAIEPFLRLAVALSAAIGRLHDHGLVHKDIKPANVIVSSVDEVRLTGFGFASPLSRERRAAEPPEIIAGTLAYMAPEQTGWMNRSIDSRSDLYALGVCLYQMLTGALPFAASDPMGWVHCHIARRPIPPAELAQVPEPVSAIVMKLLAKTAEHRYQTASGVESDLRRCLVEWEAGRSIEDVQVGQHDTPDRLFIPEKLYGRDCEVEMLLAAFARVARRGSPELILVSGYSGVGKSSVVNELHKVLVPTRGIFASGKSDQFKSDIPFSTVTQAFRSLVRRLLGKSDADLAPWRNAFREALGSNGLLMTALVPELTLVIGEQSPVAELQPQDAQRRLHLVIRRFIGVFAKPEHPLVLFLDDLQCIDAATLDFLEDLLVASDPHHLLLIGAYRDNEVGAAHPLMQKIAAVSATGRSVSQIALTALAQEHLGEMIGEALRCSGDRAAPFAQLVHEKTGGNPFFATHFLSTIAEEGLLGFDHDTGQWHWDLDRIGARGHTDNVVDLMVERLGRLPAVTRHVLEALACIGHSADITTLTIALQAVEGDVEADLWEALRMELVVRSNDSYRFAHDRVYEAAYSLIADETRPQIHLNIGRLLLAHTSEEKIEEKIFEIVGQLNKGSALMTSQTERDLAAGLNLIAGRRAMTSAAHASALKYLAAGRALLTDDCWERRRELAFSLELHSAECEFLTGALASAAERLTMLSGRAADIAEQSTVECLRIDLYTALAQVDRAISVCLGYLRKIDIEWSHSPTKEEAQEEYERVWSQLKGRAISDLVDLPLMEDPVSLATLDVLTKAIPPALFTNLNLLCLVVCRAVNLSLEQGNCDASCVAYEWLALVSGAVFGNYKAGFPFGSLGYELVDRRNLKRYQGKTYLCFAGLMPWSQHLRACADLAQRAFDVTVKDGDLTFAAYSRNVRNTYLLALGDPLADVQLEVDAGLVFASQARIGLVVDIILTQRAFIRTLRGSTNDFGSFSDVDLDELEFERRLSSDPRLAIAECWYWIRRLQARVLSGDYEAAIDASSRAERLLWTSPAFFEEAEYHFYAALAHAAVCGSRSTRQGRPHVKALRGHQDRLNEWARNCPDNFETRAFLIDAEVARIEDRVLAAERLYERAIRSAVSNGFVHNQAIACELAARFYAARGFEDIGNSYWRRARQCYLQWGADGKVRQLDQLHAGLREESGASAQTSVIGTPVKSFGFETVLKVSQEVSGETDLEKLMSTVMRFGLELAGAERGILILAFGNEYRIEVEATVGGDAVIVALRSSVVVATDLPQSVLHYVLRTRESVLLQDASAENPFSDDEYIRSHHARSMLCMPMLWQKRLIGVLYLENPLACGVFTPSRMELVNLLASHAAISLESARVYRDLQDREARVVAINDELKTEVLERRRAEEALRDSERESRLIVDSIPGFVAVFSPGGQLQFVNRPICEFFGKTREELIRWDTAGTVHPEDLPHVVETFARSIASGEPFEIELRARRSDGVYCWQQSRGFPLRDAHGNIVRWYNLLIDIDERKRAEAAIVASERDLKLIIDTIPALVWSARLDGRTEFFNKHYLDFVGLSADAASNWDWMDAVHPDDSRDVAAAWQRIMDSGAPGETEARLRRRDGDYRWFLLRVHPLRDEKGAIVKWYGINTDIEDRKRAEAELRRAYNSFADAQRLSKTGSFITDLLGEDHNWSEQAFRIFEFDPATKVSVQRIRDMIHPEDLGLFESVIQRGMGGQDVEFLFRIVTPRQTIKHVRGIAHVVEHVAGRPLFVGALQDFTEIKAAEESLDRARSDLAHVARITTLGALTASIAHEVNQPLSGIITNAGTCLRMLDDVPPNVAGARETATRMIRDGNRAADVIARLRALFSKKEFTVETLDLNEATQEVIALTLSDLRRNGVILQSRFAEDLPKVTGDRVQLQQVVMNLLRNASDAMAGVNDRPRQLLVSTEREDARSVRVVVRDAGVGLDGPAVDRLFEPFYTTKSGGMGIGLSISRSIVERHNGRLWGTANDGPGATFSFSIPCAPASAEIAQR
jgi:PAS domain S-box-containing protein